MNTKLTTMLCTVLLLAVPACCGCKDKTKKTEPVKTSIENDNEYFAHDEEESNEAEKECVKF